MKNKPDIFLTNIFPFFCCCFYKAGSLWVHLRWTSRVLGRLCISGWSKDFLFLDEAVFPLLKLFGKFKVHLYTQRKKEKKMKKGILSSHKKKREKNPRVTSTAHSSHLKLLLFTVTAGLLHFIRRKWNRSRQTGCTKTDRRRLQLYRTAFQQY